MSSENWKLYIKGEKEKYKKLGYIECPAFLNEKIYFNHYGFNHLISKGKKLRPKSEVIKRFGLLSHVRNIIKNTKSVYDEEKSIKDQSSAYFWTIKHSISNQRIRVVLRRLNNGTIHFFSIMKE